jgi:hypothetical protein|tara:strand:- start:44 stop:541 length:498 start_codon:yes stop_codon:yes gene_type:complete
MKSLIAKIKSLIKPDSIKVDPDIFDDITENFLDTINFNRPSDIKDIKSRNLFYLIDLHTQVQGGGLLSFVDNGTGIYFNEVKNALKEFKLSNYLELFQKIESLFPNQKIPDNNLEIRDYFDKVNDEESSFYINLEEFWGNIDNTFYNNLESFRHTVIVNIKNNVA